MPVAKKKTPLVQWVEASMLHSGMGQSDLARALETYLRMEFDRSKVYKIVKGERKVSAEEMLAIEEVTGFPAPAAVRGQDTTKPKLKTIPLLDRVTAGKLRAPVSQLSPEDFPLLAFADLGRGEWFALRVEEKDDGDSMDRVSPPTSIIIVNQADKELISGKCYVFSIDGETTYKMWQDGDPPYMAPYSTNPVHKPIFVKKKRDFDVIGRVKRTVLDL